MFHSSQKIQLLPEALRTRARWSLEGEKVVFTNGCFDILHLGHVDYLERAKNLGTKLIVGLNTDASVRKLKGESRPVNDEKARSRVLAALWFVDMVVLFAEDTPEQLLESLRPDILVKGADYEAETLPGYALVKSYGGEVVTLELVEGYSTTSILEKKP